MSSELCVYLIHYYYLVNNEFQGLIILTWLITLNFLLILYHFSDAFSHQNVRKQYSRDIENTLYKIGKFCTKHDVMHSLFQTCRTVG